MQHPKDFLIKETDEMIAAKKFEKAVKNLDELKNQYQQQDKDFWFDQGQYFVKKKQFNEAIHCFDKDLDLNKISYRTFFAKGVAQYENMQYNESIESLNKALEIEYANILKNKDMAKNLKNKGKFEKAVIRLDGIDKDNINSKFWHYMGLSYYQLGKYDESKKNLEYALKNEPNNKEILNLITKCKRTLESIDSSSDKSLTDSN